MIRHAIYISLKDSCFRETIDVPFIFKLEYCKWYSRNLSVADLNAGGGRCHVRCGTYSEEETQEVWIALLNIEAT